MKVSEMSCKNVLTWHHWSAVSRSSVEHQHIAFKDNISQ